MRVAGIRLADVKGYQYDRSDVTVKPLANAYSQALGAIFMGESKPYEVELLIAEVDEEPDNGDPGLELYHILYDGSIVDEHRFVAIGGEAEALMGALEQRWEPGWTATPRCAWASRPSARSRAARSPRPPWRSPGLDAARPRRRFFRLRDEALMDALGR
jgi:proteasome alpha subunit